MKHFKKPHFLAGFFLSIASTAQAVIYNVPIPALDQAAVGLSCGLLIMYLGRAKDGE